jgi:hypothetical protein
MVADVVLPDGRVLNRELVRSGNARWYWKYDRADAETKALEAHAPLQAPVLIYCQLATSPGKEKDDRLLPFRSPELLFQVMNTFGDCPH